MTRPAFRVRGGGVSAHPGGSSVCRVGLRGIWLCVLGVCACGTLGTCVSLRGLHVLFTPCRPV